MKLQPIKMIALVLLFLLASLTIAAPVAEIDTVDSTDSASSVASSHVALDDALFSDLSSADSTATATALANETLSEANAGYMHNLQVTFGRADDQWCQTWHHYKLHTLRSGGGCLEMHHHFWHFHWESYGHEWQKPYWKDFGQCTIRLYKDKHCTPHMQVTTLERALEPDVQKRCWGIKPRIGPARSTNMVCHDANGNEVVQVPMQSV